MSLIEKAAERLSGLLHEPKPQLPPAADEKAIIPPAEKITPQASSQQVEIDLHKLAAAGFLIPDRPRSTIADEFRVIKRPLLANASGRSAAPIRNANLIMVTSALPGEGKSFTALNLAMSIATELDRTVLLVDADVARPSLASLMGLKEHKGLLDVLEDSSLQLSDVLLRTNVEKLNLLMAGRSHPHATELLASETMACLLDEMSKRYADRIIIFDSPPLLVTTESRVLATHMGQIVFVVQAEESLQSAVMEALATIEACPVKAIVLNQARNIDPVIYGYGSGYGYGR
jgi:exopolysaccharide/PEP-CTERM locus tyrosine autokinase